MHSSNSRSRARSRRVIAIGSSVLLVGLVVAPAFAATHPAKNFHALDGFVMDQDPAADPPYDWDDFFNAATTAEPTKKTLPSGAISSDFTRDFLTDQAGTTYVNGDDTYFATGSKDTLSITPGWQCKHTNNATDKGDFVNGYGYAANVTVGATNHIVFFFGLEKDDDNGTNNLGFWLLQDGTVGCSQAGGGNADFIGNHVDDDLLAVISYDSGGTVGTAKGFLWEGDDTGSLNTTPAFESASANCTSPGIDETSKFCITTNASGTRATPWWSPQKGDKTTGAVLQQNVFVEGFIDITNVFGPGSEPCFAKGLADTRASTSPTASLYDFLQIEAPTCGGLTIKKYFDRDVSGTYTAASEGPPPVPAEPYLSGWLFKVFATGADPATATPLYTGTTGTDGSVSFSNVPFGTYDIYEYGQAGYYNTDPVAGTYNPAATPPTTTVKKTLTKTAADQTVVFGNACLVDATFTVNNVTQDTALQMRYFLNGSATATGPFNMTTSADGSTYKAVKTFTDTFKPTDDLTWEYALQSDSTFTNKVSGGSVDMGNYTDTSGVGTACAQSDAESFPYATLTGKKYKDADADGSVRNAADTEFEDVGIAGFDFRLWRESNNVTGLQKVADGSTPADTLTAATAASVSNGDYSFTGLSPGTYYVVEDPETGWVQTLPSSNGHRTVTVVLAANPSATQERTVSIAPFANAPLTDLSVVVHPQTNYSEGLISCVRGTTPGTNKVDGNGAESGDDVDGARGADATWSKTNLLVGTYTCTVTITDP